MAEEKEILTYQLNISDVEAKTARIKALTEEITAKRTAGEDVSGLELKLEGEVDALGRLGRQQQKAAGSAEELTRQKDKLANVVSLLGGRFGGVVGQLGNVVELLMQAGPAAAGFAVALGGVTAVVAGVQKLNEQLRVANEQLEKMQEGYKALVEQRRGPLEQIEAELLRMGALEAGRAEEVYKLILEMGKLGVTPQLALPVAPVAQVAGATPEQAALVALASTARGGQVPQTPEEMQKVIGQLGGQEGAALEQQLTALPTSGQGKRAIAQVALAQRLYAKFADQLRALFDPDTDALLRELSKQLDVDLEKIKATKPAEWRKQLGELRVRRERMQYDMQPSGAPEADVGDWVSGIRYDTLGKQIELLEELVKLQSTLVDLLSDTNQGARAPVYDIRIGSITTTGDARRSPLMGSPFSPGQGANSYKRDN